MGLDTLDETSPKDTDPISLGDDAIRETRSATKVSFGLEHYLDGPHKIPSGTTANRPAASKAGHMYFNTDTRELQVDGGTAWTSPKDSLSQSTILNHQSQFRINVGQNLEFPFDYVIADPGGFASISNHQIVMPANSICLVSLYMEFDGIVGGDYGITVAIEQWDLGSTKWNPVLQAYTNLVVAAWLPHICGIVDSGWGQQLRVTINNGSKADAYVNYTALAASPRLAMTVLGRVS